MHSLLLLAILFTFGVYSTLSLHIDKSKDGYMLTHFSNETNHLTNTILDHLSNDINIKIGTPHLLSADFEGWDKFMDGIIGGRELLDNIQLLKSITYKKLSIILINVTVDEIEPLCNLIGNTYNHIKNNNTNNNNYLIFGWIPTSLTDNERTRVISSGKVFRWQPESNVNKINLESPMNLLGSKLQGSVTDAPIHSLVPPSDIPFNYLEIIDFNQMTITFKDFQQVFSHSINSHYYMYDDSDANEINLLLIQNILAYPDTMGIVNPISAIGFFQCTFELINTLSYNGGDLPREQSRLVNYSPQTINQNVNLTVDYEVRAVVQLSDGWQSNNTKFQMYIQNWGVFDATNQQTLSPGWVFHQQNPYDAWGNGYDDFGSWWSQAYFIGSVKYPPQISTSTIQTTTISQWTFDKSLIDPTSNQLQIGIEHTVQHVGILVANPGYIDSHHKLVLNILPFNYGHQININPF